MTAPDFNALIGRVVHVTVKNGKVVGFALAEDEGDVVFPEEPHTIFTDVEGGGLHFSTGERRHNEDGDSVCHADRCATIDDVGHVWLFAKREMLTASTHVEMHDYDPYFVAANWIAFGELP